MKKTWIALAVAGVFAAGAAHAQSSVTLYGIADVNYMWEEKPTTVSGTVQQKSVSQIGSGGQSGSRWGVRGEEALGGGLKAIFTLEGGYDIDTGMSGQTYTSGTTSSTRIFGRQAWAGLSGGWGTAVAGRLATFSSGTGSFDMFGRTDPFSTGFGLAGMGNTFLSAAATRVDNAVAYQTPKWGGFQGGVGWTFNTNGQESAVPDSNNSAFISAVNWAAGPFFVVVTYDALNGKGSTPDQKHLQIGGTFDIGPFRLHAAWADQTNVGAIRLPSNVGTGGTVTLPAGFSYDNNAYMLGATWTAGAFKVFGSYQASDADGKTVTVAGVPYNVEPDYNIWGLGATYNFSRRTNVYTMYASRNADGTLLDNRFNYKQFMLGMRHLF